MADSLNMSRDQENQEGSSAPLKRSAVFSTIANRSFRPGNPTPPAAPAASPPPNKKRRLPAFWYRWSRRTQILVSAAILLVLAVAIFLVATHGNKPKNTIPNNKTINKSVKTTVASPLTGVQVHPDLAKRPVTGIMIENSTDARPQSGLQDAGVVFEAIAEGGITRFLALFQESTPQYIGPVRSLRPYYIDWATPFQAGIAHVGGSPEALQQIQLPGQRDLDQFFNPDAYWRVGSREAPHNMYTSFDKLDVLNTSKGFTQSKFNSWPRTTKESPLKQPAAKTINFAISGPEYYVTYNYDSVNNNYFRSEGGAAHNVTSSEGESTGTQLKPKVVIALIVNYGLESDAHHSAYGVDGSGTMWLFQDGGATKGTWTKDNRGAMYVFKDANGNALKLNPGQTWITVLGDESMVSYGQ